jgi:hypothetical protein
MPPLPQYHSFHRYHAFPNPFLHSFLLGSLRHQSDIFNAPLDLLLYKKMSYFFYPGKTFEKKELRKSTIHFQLHRGDSFRGSTILLFYFPAVLCHTEIFSLKKSFHEIFGRTKRGKRDCFVFKLEETFEDFKIICQNQKISRATLLYKK